MDLAFGYAESLGIATYDPFDTKGCSLGMWAYGSGAPYRVLVRKVFNGLDLLFPIGLRKVLRLPKVPSHGGVARWAQANVAYGRLKGDSSYFDRAVELVEWLRDHPGTAPVGKGWGLPFDWQAFVVVPANSAIGHTTMSVVNALLEVREVAPQDWMEGELREACRFLAEGLNQTVRESGAVALSYTPLDHSQVMNTNAEIAAVLARLGREFGEDEWVDLAAKVTRFVLETQNEDASWYYSAPDAGEGRQVVDHYHTGMILTALMELDDEGIERDGVREAMNRGLEFHVREHFDGEGCPKMRPHTAYPIDSYSGGESLVMLSLACQHEGVREDLRVTSRETLDRLASYMTGRMMEKDGCFLYRIWPQKAMRLESLRWAQALVCQGLAMFCELRQSEAV